ncbi:hypothetical protein MMC14_002048 [Varicellaria rhodocarpa]|nr:hypothetical protein [Varicellaria rhodocarpa]
MKTSLAILAVLGISAFLGVEASRSTQKVWCLGDNDNCNPDHQTELKGEALLARDLFTRQPGEALHQRAAIAGKPKSSPKQGTKGPAKRKASAKHQPLTIDQITSMINNNQRLPAALEGPKLSDNNIPPEILSAAKAKWGGSSANGVAHGIAVKGKAVLRREADPDAFGDDVPFDLWERDTDPEPFYHSGLYERDAEPDAFYDGQYGLYERDAEPESFPADDYFGVYERDAEPESFGNGFYDIYERDADQQRMFSVIWGREAITMGGRLQYTTLLESSITFFSATFSTRSSSFITSGVAFADQSEFDKPSELILDRPGPLPLNGMSESRLAAPLCKVMHITLGFRVTFQIPRIITQSTNV